MKKKIKSKTKQNSRKSKVTKKSSSILIDVSLICLLLVSFVLLIHVLVNGFYVPFFGPKDIKKGQCYSNRSYSYYQVTSVYTSLNEVYFRDMKIQSISGIEGEELGWYLTPVGSYFKIERTLDFVRANYTEVPCRNLYPRE